MCLAGSDLCVTLLVVSFSVEREHEDYLPFSVKRVCFEDGWARVMSRHRVRTCAS